MEIKYLPVEIRDLIVYYAGFDLAIITNNRYIIQKLKKEHDCSREGSWEELIITYPVRVLDFLHKTGYNLLGFIQLQQAPPCNTEYILNNVIFEKDMEKIEWIELYFPNWICSEETAKTSSKEIYQWVQKTRPIHFIGYRVKKIKCEALSQLELDKMPIDIIKEYNSRKVKCTCKNCGGDHIGYCF